MLAGRPAGESPFPCVETRHEEGIAPAVEHLAALGHERIGFLGGRPEYEHVQAREAAWRAALGARGLAPGPVGSVEGEVTPSAGVGASDARSAALRLLRDDVTAIVCSSDALAIEAIAAARSDGRSVPDDLSVVGFDDSALAAFAAPALTSVRIDYAEFGEAAAHALLACIAGEAVPEYAPAAPELVVRASTGRVPPRWRSES